MILYSKENPSSYTIGGKAQGLYRLREAGMPLPDFLIIPAETFDLLLEAVWNATADASEDVGSAAEAAAELAQKSLLNYNLPREELALLEKHLQEWGFPASAVVVRSSVADEDGLLHAFPGMMDSFLNLQRMEDVAEAIARCAASAFSDRAMAYRKERGLSPRARPAVVVQQQITPDASGVMFSTYPDFPQELAIHACPGFGEGLVAGKVDADEFYFLKKTGKLHRSLICRKESSLQAARHKGLQECPLAEEIREAPSLTEEQLEGLWALGSQLETALAGPQDIEFAIKGSEIYLLQTRPVTQEIPEIIVYDNSNIQESYCGVTTPLTFSFASRAYATVYRQTMRTLGLPEKVINDREAVVNNLLGLVKGRIYYNINNWYRGLQLLPSFRQNKDDMERMMGLEEPVDFVENREKSLREKARLLPGLLLNLTRLLYNFSQLKKKVAAFQSNFQAHYHQFYLQPWKAAGPAELLAKKEKLDSALLRNWTTPIINDFYVMMNNGSAQRKLKQAGILEPEEFLSRFLSGDPEIESTQPTRAMQKLAAQALQNTSLQTLILALPDQLHEQVEQEFPDFHHNVIDFISRYGDRTVGELKLETPTMRSQPLIFYKYLRNYLHPDSSVPATAPGAGSATETAPGARFASAPESATIHGPETESEPGPESATAPALDSSSATAPASLLGIQQQALPEYSRLSAAAHQELEKALKKRNYLFRKQVWGSLKKLRQSIRYRESLRLERTRLFGMYRSLYLQMGQRLAVAGAINQPGDIFYLNETEILSTLQRPLASMESLILSRQEEFMRYKQEEVPGRVIIPSPPAPLKEQREEDAEEAGVLRGAGCYPGVASAEVIVISDPSDELDVKDKIVCALRTDPGWAALFPMCRGVLIEKGSSLSHSVILLRELGIPTIINIPGLTKRLRSGDKVHMDSSSGTIRIVSNKQVVGYEQD